MGERLAMIAQIVRQPAWVTEGGHLGWTEPLFAAADVIVWLDPPLHVLLRRHWVRHRRRGLRWLVRYGWSWQLRWYFQGYKHDLAMDVDTTISRAATAVALTSYGYKMRRLRSALGADGLDQVLQVIPP
jgi:hypothetical protein